MTTAWKVLASQRPPGPDFDRLAEVEILPAPLPDGLDRARPGVQALVSFNEPVGDRMLDLLPDLELVASYGVGYDAIDVTACTHRGVAVVNTPGAVDVATADLAFALLFAVRRRVTEADRFVRAGRWAAGDSFGLASEATGSTLGLVGCGRIGQAVARRARGFDMPVLYTARNRLDPGLEEELGAAYRPLERLLADADIVSLHCPLTPETTGLLDARRLGLLRPGACLINTARGAVVDETALVEALVSRRISAGLDVFAHEPSVPAALLELPNVVLLPHLGSATTETRTAMTRLVVENILAAQSGQPLLTPVEV